MSVTMLHVSLLHHVACFLAPPCCMFPHSTMLHVSSLHHVACFLAPPCCMFPHSTMLHVSSLHHVPSLQIYGDSKLLFCDHILNGYGYTQRDFKKQISKSRIDFLHGQSLPNDFRFRSAQRLFPPPPSPPPLR